LPRAVCYNGRVPELEPADQHRLVAVIGWIELGNPAEAAAELAQWPAALRAHPDALEIEFALLSHRADWPAALDVARRLVEVAPDRASGWLHRSYAVRRVTEGGLRAAWDALRPAADQFPKEPVIAYNLSCYAAQLGELAEAWDWLKRAAALADEGCIARMAVADDDLAPLRDRLKEL
jgi:Flp pilus assembly protein TadD